MAHENRWFTYKKGWIFSMAMLNNQRVFQETWFLTQTYPDYVSIFSVSVEEHYHKMSMHFDGVG